MSTLNKWNRSTGFLNPALKSGGYDTIAFQMAKANPTKTAADLMPEFTAKLESMGLRATSESFSEYFNAKVAALKAIPSASVVETKRKAS